MEKRILIVDDDLHSREGLRDTLLGEGHRVETSADSWQAIRKIKEGVFDIAIIDLDLPAFHGVVVTAWDLARIFRAYHPAISIIVVSAEEERTVRAQAEQLRVSEFLVKPISPSKLKAIVRTLNPLSGECPASPDSRCGDNSSRISPRRNTGLSPLVGLARIIHESLRHPHRVPPGCPLPHPEGTWERGPNS
ncbi:MAG: response regulator [candidate division NC10 bacterium]|nr:response regulator [candidate division NC10 bacterium]